MKTLDKLFKSETKLLNCIKDKNKCANHLNTFEKLYIDEIHPLRKKMMTDLLNTNTKKLDKTIANLKKKELQIAKHPSTLQLANCILEKCNKENYSNLKNKNQNYNNGCNKQKENKQKIKNICTMQKYTQKLLQNNINKISAKDIIKFNIQSIKYSEAPYITFTDPQSRIGHK